jgi:hypothetical protein
MTMFSANRFGLNHTFGGFCQYDADGLSDTPMEWEPNYGCTEGVDSCPDAPGLDPIHNYME